MPSDSRTASLGRSRCPYSCPASSWIASFPSTSIHFLSSQLRPEEYCVSSCFQSLYALRSLRCHPPIRCSLLPLLQTSIDVFQPSWVWAFQPYFSCGCLTEWRTTYPIQPRSPELNSHIHGPLTSSLPFWPPTVCSQLQRWLLGC